MNKFIRYNKWFLLLVGIGLFQVAVQMTPRDALAGGVVAAYALLGYWLQVRVNKYNDMDG